MSFILEFFIIFLICWALRKWILTYITSYKIPGPWSIPLIGSIHMVPKLQPDKILSTLRDLRKQYGKTFRVWLGPKLWVFLHTPEETRQALTNPTLIKPSVFHFLVPIFGNSLFMRNGKEWEQHRRFLEPAFHSNILKSMQEKINFHSNIFVQNLSKLESNVSDVTEDIFNCVVDTIVDTFMGENLQIQLGNNSAYVQAIHRINKLSFERMINPLLFSEFIYKMTPMGRDFNKSLQIVHYKMDRVIQKRKQFLSVKKDETCEILLDILIKASSDGLGFTDKDIRDEIDTLLLAGADTTSTGLTFALYALAKYPKEQQKVVEEIQKIKRDCKHGEHLDVLHKYKYLDMFIKESLRVYPPVVTTGRRTTCRTKIGQHTYEPGVDIWLSLDGMAHDAEYFDEPEQFRPERFSHEAIMSIPPFSFIPFSGYPRVCIGRRFALIIMKTMIIKTLEKFELLLADSPNSDILFRVEIVLRPKNGINTMFKKRLPEVVF